MAQVTIYVDEDTERRLRDAAATAGVSVSRWIADLVRARTMATWPADVAGYAGSWGSDEVDGSPSVADDVPREPL